MPDHPYRGFTVKTTGKPAPRGILRLDVLFPGQTISGEMLCSCCKCSLLSEEPAKCQWELSQTDVSAGAIAERHEEEQCDFSFPLIGDGSPKGWGIVQSRRHEAVQSIVVSVHRFRLGSGSGPL